MCGQSFCVTATAVRKEVFFPLDNVAELSTNMLIVETLGNIITQTRFYQYTLFHEKIKNTFQTFKVEQFLNH